jgi:hypothetical protein
MELKDLQKTWSRLSSGMELDENQIREMLRRRTSSLIDRINRNIRIGFIVLFVLITLFVADDYIFASMLTSDPEMGAVMPQWLIFLSIFSNILIISAFIYFAVKYYRVQKSCDISCNLKETIVRIIEILRIYQRLFYLTLFVFALALALQFISGVYTGIVYDLDSQGIQVSEIEWNQWLMVSGVGLLVLILSVGGIFLLMQWGFRRLYGKYIDKLKEMLNELNELAG